MTIDTLKLMRVLSHQVFQLVALDEIEREHIGQYNITSADPNMYSRNIPGINWVIALLANLKCGVEVKPVEIPLTEIKESKNEFNDPQAI